MSELVSLTLGEIAELQLSSPPLNLVTTEVTAALREALSAVARDTAVRVLVVTGGPQVFCAGSDVREFAGLHGRVAEGKLLFEKLVYRQLARLPIPTVAAIEGHALGGGLELALCCDLRVAADGASLGLPELRLGVVPGSGGTQRLPRIVGVARAKQMILLSEILTAAQALDAGLVTFVTERGGALAKAREVASVMAGRAPLAVRAAKRLLDAASELPLEEGLAIELDYSETVFASDDLLEGADAFIGKRTAQFSGR